MQSSDKQNPKLSFHDTLLGTSTLAQPNFISIKFHQVYAVLGNPKDLTNLNCPMITVTKEEYFQMCKPWYKSLAIKLLGSDLGYTGIKTRIM